MDVISEIKKINEHLIAIEEVMKTDSPSQEDILNRLGILNRIQKNILSHYKNLRDQNQDEEILATDQDLFCDGVDLLEKAQEIFIGLSNSTLKVTSRSMIDCIELILIPYRPQQKTIYQ